jgi:two-component system CheB/CheR fusion protein
VVAENTIPETSSEQGVSGDFPIVGIGASAGGLEAFEVFFRNVPPDSGMAFVVISHLDPSHESILTDILQRSTDMIVVEAQDQMTVEANRVYVIPPNRDMAIFHGQLQLSIPELPHGARLPIDTFFRSLAEDYGEQAVGIILSGAGTDGTLGLRAILGAGGISLVQEPSTAKFDGMPSSAINAGYATHILPVEKMADALKSGLRRLYQPPVIPAEELGDLNRILMLLRNVTGHDFSQYKKSTISRRIERRMMQNGLDNKTVYARYLKENPLEISLLFKELLINVTSFFRDTAAFEAIKHEVLPKLLAGKAADDVLRIWVAGCATGEEAYSLAIVLREYLDEHHQQYKIQLFATDLDDEAIATARTGIYPPNIVQDVHPERLQRFFIKEDVGYRIKKFIREMVVFAVQNVIKDPPFTHLDMVSCRNLLIYLEPPLQSRLISAFHFALNGGGVLFLSPSESIGTQVELFKPLSRKWKLYIATGKTVASCTLPDVKRRPIEANTDVTGVTNFAELTRRVLLQTYAPASVVTDAQGNILYVHGDTGKYLRPAPGHATLNIVDMAREGLQLSLGQAITATLQHTPVLNHEVTIRINGQIHAVRFSVRQIDSKQTGGEDGRVKLLLISFQDQVHTPPARPAKALPRRAELRRLEELERELAFSRENLQATLEGEQASGEELKSINEELQSTNEELQSTNEEFETSQEELRSLNEEMATVNAELQARIEQLMTVQNDLKNLLDNINIGTLFLDEKLRIRRYTGDASQLYRLVTTDLGRRLTDIKSNFEGPDLQAEIEGVLATLIPCDRQLRTLDGRWYHARIQPYRTLDNVIDGVLLTFGDVSERVQAEQNRVEPRELAQNIVNTVCDPLLVLDADFRVVAASRSYYQYFKCGDAQCSGCSVYEISNRLWDTPVMHEVLERVLPDSGTVDRVRIDYESPANSHRTLYLNARHIIGKTLILIGMELLP